MAADRRHGRTARKAILERLRGAPYRGGSFDRDTVMAGATPVPASGSNRFDHFVARVRASGASLAEVDSGAEVYSAMTHWLADHGGATELVTGTDTAIHELGQHRRDGQPELATRPFGEHDRVTLTHACAAVAETGSLVLESGADNPATLSFLPEINIILLRRGDVLGTLDDLWPRLRARGPGLPRCINLVTGPSRTADIEQTIQLGAHGPRHVHVIVYRTSEP